MREEVRYTKVLKQLLQWVKNQYDIDTGDFTIIINQTNNGNFRYTLNKEFSLPYSNKKFSLLFINIRGHTSVLLLDNKRLHMYWFCSIYKICGMNCGSFSSFLKRKFNKQWKVVEVIPNNKNVSLPINPKELALQNLIWQFLFIDLKVNNNNLSNDLLIEYLLNNSNKRQFTKIFQEFYKNVKKANKNFKENESFTTRI